MSDINYWHDEYSKEMDQLGLFVDKLRVLVASSNVRAIDSACRECESKAARVREVKKSFNLELRLVRDRDERNQFDAKAKLLEERFNEMTKFVTQTKNNNGKKELVGGDSGSRNLYSTEGKDNDALLGEANKLQDKTFESLGRTRNMIEASREIGHATIEQLRGQREQIVEIDAEIDRLDTHLVRAEKLVFSFAKRMASDKIIRGFFCINIVLMLSLILYVVISGKSLSPSSGSSGGGPAAANSPTFQPSPIPLFNATIAPSFGPTLVPTLVPSVLPSISPTFVPTSTFAPSVVPTISPSAVPTSTFAPSALPSTDPTQLPTVVPTTIQPTFDPTVGPTVGPSAVPTAVPTISPSVLPTAAPSFGPTLSPTVIPSPLPTTAPTDAPTQAPSAAPV